MKNKYINKKTSVALHNKNRAQPQPTGLLRLLLFLTKMATAASGRVLFISLDSTGFPWNWLYLSQNPTNIISNCFPGKYDENKDIVLTFFLNFVFNG